MINFVTFVVMVASSRFFLFAALCDGFILLIREMAQAECGEMKRLESRERRNLVHAATAVL